MSKKVGILTVLHNTANYGTHLQAYALQKAIQELSFDCEHILFNNKTATSEDYLPSTTPKLKAFLEKIPHNERVYSHEDIGCVVDQYDIFVCGSDAVWFNGYSETMLTKYTLQYVPQDKVKIAYAPSLCGDKIVTNKNKSIIKDALSELDAISVREQCVKSELESLTDKQIHKVLDPTFLVDVSEWHKLSVEPPTKDEYIFCYFIEKQNIERIRAFAEELANNLECNIVFPNIISDDDKYFLFEDYGVGEFLGLIKNAKAVVTSAFHGMVFSIIFKKHFYVLDSYYKNPFVEPAARLSDLAEVFNIGNRIFNTYDVSEILAVDSPIDYEKVGIVIEKKRRESIGFLTAALSIDKKNSFITPKRFCCGCTACVSICPSDCISMIPDKFGFMYPSIDSENCTGCEQCRKICPAANPIPEDIGHLPVAYAAYASDDNIRLSSSSGGIFSVLAENTIKKGGVVFGAEFDDDFYVHHTGIDLVDDLKKLRGTKYIQSRVENTYREAKNYLEQGREVLFSGVPCQIEGLKSYLCRKYDNLIAVDLICEGVASPELFQKYLRFCELSCDSKAETFSFRNKMFGWANFNLNLKCENGSSQSNLYFEDMFYCLFLYGSLKLPACYNCQMKKMNRESDITLGDFWWIDSVAPDMNDDKGVSAVLLHTQKGEEIFESCSGRLKTRKVGAKSVLNGNPMLTSSAREPSYNAYLKSIFSEASIEKLHFEQLSSRYSIEIERETMRGKILLQMKDLQLSGYDSDVLTHRIMIYGAGKIGKQLCELLNDKMICFIDDAYTFTSGNLLNGFPVYHSNDETLKRLIDNEGKCSILVTPVWDFNYIHDNLYRTDKTDIISVRDILDMIKS